MNLLSRSKLSGRIRRYALYYAAPLQQLNSYSTSKTLKSTFPKSQKSSFPERVNKPTGDVIFWPKPVEIPYQAKVANSVNLIGRVKAPVQFDTVSDGKHFAATVISQEISGGGNLLSIPVVFEGDLAHVVACHVKENDFVLVSGKLSSEPMRIALRDSVGKFHVVGDNLNFVEGFKKDVYPKNPADGGIGNVVDEEFDKQWKEALDAKMKKLSVEKDRWSSAAIKKKKGDQSLDLWRDLVRNSLLWLDYRDRKAKGMVKERFPDFKHKETGDALWIDSAPDWVLKGLGKLEFDVQVTKVQGGEGSGVSDEDSWKDLVENPFKWWDNRANKRNPKGPDFKHKETGKGLWVRDTPDWASSRLPQLK